MIRSIPLTGVLRRAGLLLIASAALAVAACAPDAGPGSAEPAATAAPTAPAKPGLVLYSGQHEGMALALAKAFERDTGIPVQVRVGKDGALANQIIEEGARAQADVFITEEPGPIGNLARRGLLLPVPAATLAKAAAGFAPADGLWLPWAARSRVYFYNPTLIAEKDLPASILELADPRWKGRFAYAPSGAFVSTTAYLLKKFGPERTLAWLKAIRENGVNEQKNGKVRDSVEAGQHAFGLSNHYYWYILARKAGGADKLTSRVHFLNNDDAGALVLASGAAVLTSSTHREQALQFLDWLISAQGGQQIVAQSSPQFPLNPQVNSSYDLPPIEKLEFPHFDQGELDNVNEASELLKQAGII